MTQLRKADHKHAHPKTRSVDFTLRVPWESQFWLRTLTPSSIHGARTVPTPRGMASCTRRSPTTIPARSGSDRHTFIHSSPRRRLDLPSKVGRSAPWNGAESAARPVLLLGVCEKRRGGPATANTAGNCCYSGSSRPMKASYNGVAVPAHGKAIEFHNNAFSVPDA